MSEAMASPPIALLTDFGDRDFFAGSLKAVIAAINPRAVTVDITHNAPPFDPAAAGFLLTACYGFFPEGTIFLSVVDPGVAAGRKIILVLTPRYRFIAPDNGLLTMPLEREKVLEVREVRSRRFFLSAGRTTFEGRDRMAPAAAWLSLGVDPRELGPRLRAVKKIRVPRPARTASGIRGAVLYADHFGNLITNIPARMLERLRQGRPASRPVLRIAGRDIRDFRKSYASAKAGAPFALIDSLGLVEIAVREASAASVLGARPGTAVLLLGGGPR
jgi:S-adenosylmethionine hydrolase